MEIEINKEVIEKFERWKSYEKQEMSITDFIDFNLDLIFQDY